MAVRVRDQTFSSTLEDSCMLVRKAVLVDILTFMSSFLGLYALLRLVS